MKTKINDLLSLKNLRSTKLIVITLVVLTLALVNCKDKTTDEPDPEPAKTLNKSLITGKYWKTNYATQWQFDHYFGSDGKYYLPDGKTQDGTWKWLNNSDSMEIDEPIYGKTVWYVKYCTETELYMRQSANPTGYTYYKQ